MCVAAGGSIECDYNQGKRVESMIAQRDFLARACGTLRAGAIYPLAV